MRHFKITERGLVLQVEFLRRIAKFAQGFLQRSIEVCITPLQEIVRILIPEKLNIVLKDSKAVTELVGIFCNFFVAIYELRHVNECRAGDLKHPLSIGYRL
jgi:hypothetical protein